MRLFGKGVAPGLRPPAGWVTGKLLEKAAARNTEPPTSKAILEGLWSIRNDTLGGITAPLTFEKEKPAAKIACWFGVMTKNQTWTSVDGFKMHCRDKPLP